MNPEFFEKIIGHLKSLKPKDQAWVIDHTFIFATGVWLFLYTLTSSEYIKELQNQLGIILAPYSAVLGIIAFILLASVSCYIVISRLSHYS